MTTPGSLDLRGHCRDLFAAALQAIAPGTTTPVVIEKPKQTQHGDFACNVALQLAKALQRKPRDIAAALVAALPASPCIDRTEIAGPGFINVFLKPAAKQAIVPHILAAGTTYGRSDRGGGRRVQVEFVSANPTGPLHVGHGRQAALGDALAALLESQGHAVTREFYYNDAGAQIEKLAHSVAARGRGLKPGDPGWPEEAYAGEYVDDIARDYAAGGGSFEDGDAVRRYAVAYLRREQDADLQAFGVAFDVYYLESSLYAEGRVQRVVEAWQAQGKSYEQDGALWLRTTDYGDDKDRVVRKSDGSYTYFVPDVAYHVTKWERGYTTVINVQGTDHHSTITRVRGGLQALAIGIPQGYPDYVLHNMVKVMRGGAEVKISKRAGSYVTVRDLIDWVGRDAVRYFLIQRRADTEFVFDVDLALSKSDENPVYYIQYAHARICTMINNAGMPAADVAAADVSVLTAPSEFALMQRLAEFPHVVALAAQDLSPHHIAFWLRDCASDFHAWYSAERVLVDDVALKLARLRLAATTRQVLANGLELLGVSAPERM